MLLLLILTLVNPELLINLVLRLPFPFLLSFYFHLKKNYFYMLYRMKWLHDAKQTYVLARQQKFNENNLISRFPTNSTIDHLMVLFISYFPTGWTSHSLKWIDKFSVETLRQLLYTHDDPVRSQRLVLTSN